MAAETCGSVGSGLRSRRKTQPRCSLVQARQSSWLLPHTALQLDYSVPAAWCLFEWANDIVARVGQADTVPLSVLEEPLPEGCRPRLLGLLSHSEPLSDRW